MAKRGLDFLRYFLLFLGPEVWIFSSFVEGFLRCFFLTKQAGATNRDKTERERETEERREERSHETVSSCGVLRFELFLASKDYSIFSDFVVGVSSFQ